MPSKTKQQKLKNIGKKRKNKQDTNRRDPPLTPMTRCWALSLSLSLYIYIYNIYGGFPFVGGPKLPPKTLRLFQFLLWLVRGCRPSGFTLGPIGSIEMQRVCSICFHCAAPLLKQVLLRALHAFWAHNAFKNELC